MRAAKASVKNKKVNGKLGLLFQYFGGGEGITPAVTGEEKDIHGRRLISSAIPSSGVCKPRKRQERRGKG